MISCASSSTSTACLKAGTSKSPAMSRKCIRFSDARLHAESSRNMYSEQGLDALMRAVPEHVCQWFTVVSNCIPGSPHRCAASAISRNTSRARRVSSGWPSRTVRVCHGPSVTTAFMKSSVTRTELFEFWKNTDEYASPLNDASYPASMSAQAFFSSLDLHRMNSSTSGWSALRMTIFAARRVLPPFLMTPAKASKPRMNDTGPDAVPPPASSSLLPRMVDRLLPVPLPYLKSMPSVRASVRMDSMESSTLLMKHAEHCGCASTPTLNQTGELNDAFCRRSRCVSSAWNVSRSASVEK